MANEKIYNCGANTDMGTKSNTYVTGTASFGYSVSAGTTRSGALRFVSLDINQGTTVNEAKLYFRIDDATPNGDANIYFKVWGIDEDNTGTFSSDPFGRTKTSNSTTKWWGAPTDGSWGDIDVTSIVNEILGRGGWSSGNAIGFFLLDNGTATDQSRYVTDNYGAGSNSYLMVRATAEPNFKPTPQTVSAPTFPDSEDFGIRISKPGYDVLESRADDELQYTSKKKLFQVYEEGEVELSGGTATITHGLGYNPAVLAYANHSGKKYRFPDFFDLNAGGIIYTNKTQAKISSTADKVYYYIFIDSLDII